MAMVQGRVDQSSLLSRDDYEVSCLELDELVAAAQMWMGFMAAE